MRPLAPHRDRSAPPNRPLRYAICTVVSRDVKLGEATILNVGALIDHHVEIGYGCHILMEAVVRNKIKIEPLTRVESLSLVE